MPTPQDSLPETMPAAEFKAKCPAIITKFGHPVAKLVPCASDSEAPELWGSCREEITVNADLTTPIDSDPDWLNDWEAEWDELLPRVSFHVP